MAWILAGTSTGLVSITPGAGGALGGLEGRDVRALAPQTWTRLWAIVDGREIWRTGEDSAWSPVASTEGAPELRELELTCLADTRANILGGILAGTSHARLLRVDGAGRLDVVESFDRAPGRDGWFTPWGGPPAVRTITEDGERVLVNVHVGGVLRSRDEGASWEPTLDIRADVHRVVTGAGRVYAAGATGLSVSEDGGDGWRLSAEGLHAAYCRSIAVCGDALLLSASEGPHGARAALYRSSLEGRRFERCREGLPEWFEGNLDSLSVDALPDGGLAAFATESGDVYASTDQGASWAREAAGLGQVRCVLTLP